MCLGSGSCNELQFSCHDAPTCNAFECSNMTCLDDDTNISKPKCLKWSCTRYECKKRGSNGTCLQLDCADFICTQFGKSERKCNEFNCNGYNCINWEGDSLDQCPEFECAKYAPQAQPQDYIECTELKCKNDTNSTNQCKKYKPQKTCVEWASNNTNLSYFKPRCKQKERICLEYEASVDILSQCKRLTCLDDDGNNYFKPQCKRMKAKCMKYEPVIDDSRTHSKPNCISWECLEYEPDFVNSNSSGTKCQNWKCTEYGNAPDDENEYPKPKCKRWGSQCKKYAPAIDDGESDCKRWDTIHVCADKIQCISKSMKCDGIVDCRNGKDERAETCGKFQFVTY